MADIRMAPEGTGHLAVGFLFAVASACSGAQGGGANADGGAAEEEGVTTPDAGRDCIQVELPTAPADAALWPPVAEPGETFDAGERHQSGCPVNEPVVAPCEGEAGPCDYGESLSTECRRSWACFNGFWGTSGEPCVMLERAACGDSPENLMGSRCDRDRVVCEFPELGVSCICSVSFDERDGYWGCERDNGETVDGCPAVSPNRGTDCDHEGLWCGYRYQESMDCHQTAATCVSGSWEEGMGNCHPVP